MRSSVTGVFSRSWRRNWRVSRGHLHPAGEEPSGGRVSLTAHGAYRYQ